MAEEIGNMWNFPPETKLAATKANVFKGMYERFNNSLSMAQRSLKRTFKRQIKDILWLNKLAANTLHLEREQQAREIQVFIIDLIEPDLHRDILQQLDKIVPYYILFILRYQNRRQAIVAYKEFDEEGNVSKVDPYFGTGWLAETESPFEFKAASSIEGVYTNIIRQVAGSALSYFDTSRSLKENIEIQTQLKFLQAQIDNLNQKIRREKQPKEKHRLFACKKEFEEQKRHFIINL